MNIWLISPLHILIKKPALNTYYFVIYFIALIFISNYLRATLVNGSEDMWKMIRQNGHSLRSDGESK